MDHHSLLGFMSLVWIFLSPTWSLKSSALQRTDYFQFPCEKLIKVDNQYRERILTLRPCRSGMKKSGIKKRCTVTYKTTPPLLEAYDLCGYFSDKPVDCDTEITMGYRLYYKKKLTCRDQPSSFCARDGVLKISMRSKNYCELGSFKIKLQERKPNTVYVIHPFKCPSISTYYHLSGTVISQFSPHWHIAQALCNVTLDVPHRPVFCYRFYNRADGDVIEIKVDDCVMKFGGGETEILDDKQICVKRKQRSPVTVRMIPRRFHYKKQFYLFDYSFEKEKDMFNVETHCPAKSDDDDDDLEPYQIVLICLGTVVALIIFYKCCCRKAKTLQEEENDMPGSNSDLHYRDDQISLRSEADYSVPLSRRDPSVTEPSVQETEVPETLLVPSPIEPSAPEPEPSPPELRPSEPPSLARPSTFTTATSDEHAAPPSYYSLFPGGERT